MMNEIRAGLFALLALLAALAQAAAQTTPFRLCSDPDNPPLSSDASSTPGIYIELGRRIAATLGRPFEPVWTQHLFAKLGAKLRMGECDGVIGLPEDAHVTGPDVILSHPFLAVGYALVTPPAITVGSLADFDGRRVAVQFGSPPQRLLAEHNGIETVTVMQPLQGLQALAAGKADAAFLWGPSASWINRTDLNDAYKVVPVAGKHLRWRVVIGFAKTQAALRDAVDRALAGLGDSTRALMVKYGLATAAPVVLTESPAAPASQASSQQATASTPSASPQEVAAGHQVFNANCEHCHGHDAIEGLEQRNLRHLRKRHGDKMDQVFMFTVTHGLPAKGMPNWSGILTTAQFRAILAYLHSVQEP